jgi:hypothetical protein
MQKAMWAAYKELEPFRVADTSGNVKYQFKLGLETIAFMVPLGSPCFFP